MTGRLFSLAACTLVLLSCAGCRLGRYHLTEPVEDRVVEVMSGDRWYVHLNEDTSSGYRWQGKSDDADVDVIIRHLPSEAEVTIRVHRGYDGPTMVTLKNKNVRTGDVKREVRLGLYHRTGDVAPWKQ